MNEKLIEHLEAMLTCESDKLAAMAVEAMEDASALPFPEKSLAEWRERYKLLQQRIFGILDAIEEVKAFSEGFYNKNSSNEKEGA